MTFDTTPAPIVELSGSSASMRQVAVSGATGFVGRALVARLAAMEGTNVLALTRQNPTNLMPGVQYVEAGDLASEKQWQSGLTGVHTLVHTAGRAHILNDRVSDPLAAFRLVNTEGTLRLAERAASMGVQRFVFVSSIGVNGMQTGFGKAFSEADEPCAHNAYALSKWEAEQGLSRIADETGLEVVIIRPPLVYGPSAPGNFGSLMRAVQRGWPLPLGAIHNQRSLVGLDNLLDFILTCIVHPQAADQTFLVSDGYDLSTTELVRGIAHAAGVPARLVPVPVWGLQAGATLMGKRDAVQRICGNLQVDISKARSLLGWTPPVTVEEGLRRVISEGQNL